MIVGVLQWSSWSAQIFAVKTQIDSSLKQLQNVAITNTGNINWQDGNIRFDAPNSTLINNGTFTISGNNTSFFNGGRLSVTNNATITKTSTGTSSVTGILLFARIFPFQSKTIITTRNSPA